LKKFDLILTTAVASAILLTGCSRSDDWNTNRDTAVCTDRQGHRVPDANCERSAHGGGGGGNPFLWYYLGRNSAIPPYGERPFGGSYTRTAGATYFHAPVSTDFTRSAVISRGGFGESAHAFGGFGE
jgi:hypothetical protein